MLRHDLLSIWFDMYQQHEVCAFAEAEAATAATAVGSIPGSILIFSIG